MKSALFVDFDDSFSFNVVEALERLGVETEVINWKELEFIPKDVLLVLGPGPGHPDDYQRIFPLIRDWALKKKPLFGICLGHQIFWRLQGEEVVRSKHPLHGQRVRLELTEEWRNWLRLDKEVTVLAQRYNSLAVMEEARIRSPFFKNFIQDDEVLITRGENLITYQFHPESVGTTYQEAFMRPILDLLV